MSLHDLRRDYDGPPLVEADASDEPVAILLSWLRAAATVESDANAMALATVAADGQPSVRMVLLKDADTRGLTFFTNYESRKGVELSGNPRVAAVFFWRSLERQVRVEGQVELVSAEESDAYFAVRPLESRWSAAASPQSRHVSSREELEEAVAVVRSRYGSDVPRPRAWGGYRIVPDAFEFWQGRPNRLHDRLRFESRAGAWHRVRLAP